MSGPLLVVDDGPVRTITFNRPEVRNAIDQATATALACALDELDADPELAVGVITAVGGHFCAGMDLRAFLETGIPMTEGRGFGGITARAADKPLIAAVEGYALGGGFEIALACDIIVASRSARFGLPEVKLGLVAGAGGIMRLPQRLPHYVAMRMILTGDALEATDAERYGLLSVLCDEGTATVTATGLAARIAANGPLAIRASKRLVRTARVWPEHEMFERQRHIVDPVSASVDAREGVDAFLSHRAPTWRAR